MVYNYMQFYPPAADSKNERFHRGCQKGKRTKSVMREK